MRNYANSCKVLLALLGLSFATTDCRAWAADETVEKAAVEQTLPEKTVARESRVYLLKVTGYALPLKSATMGGINVLGGPILTLSLPINISGYIKAGANALELEYVSDKNRAFTVTIEKRTPGPKTEEVAVLTIPADDSKGQLVKKTITFNIARGDETSTISAVSDADKKAIMDQFETYYNALKEHKSEKIKQLYKTCLDNERKLIPESVKFFEKVVNREAQKVRNTSIELPDFDREGLNFKIEGDKVRLFRDNNKPLLLSNEIEVEPDSVMVEVQQPVKAKAPVVPEKPKSKSKTSTPAETVKEAAKPTLGNLNQTEMQVVEALHNSGKKTEADNASAPQAGKGPVKERLVRFNLYFMRDEDGSWTLAIPPNV